MSNTEVLNRKEAAEFLRIPLRALDYLIASKQVPYSRIGQRRIAFKKDRLLSYLDEREGVVYNRPTKLKSDEN